MNWAGTGIQVLLLLSHAINFFIHAANIYCIYSVPSIGLCAGKKRRLVEYVLYPWIYHECLYVHTPSFLYLMGLIRAHHTTSLSSGLCQLIFNPQSLFFFSCTTLEYIKKQSFPPAFQWYLQETQERSTSQFSSVVQSCPTLCNSVNCSTPGLPVHYQLLEPTQTRVHWVGDAIQPSHPLSPPSPPAFNLSQHQGLFQWISSSHQVAKVLEFQLQHQSSQWIFRTDFL